MSILYLYCIYTILYTVSCENTVYCNLYIWVLVFHQVGFSVDSVQYNTYTLICEYPVYTVICENNVNCFLYIWVLGFPGRFLSWQCTKQYIYYAHKICEYTVNSNCVNIQCTVICENTGYTVICIPVICLHDPLVPLGRFLCWQCTKQYTLHCNLWIYWHCNLWIYIAL